MQWRASTALSVSLFSLIALATANSANAQITGEVEATVSHSFIVSSKTLPPGKYIFRIQGNSTAGVMSVVSADGKQSDDFMVRQSQAPTPPAHSMLVFRRYGDKEFLSKVYQAGNAVGVAVAEPSKLERQLMAQGQRASEHTEESVAQ